MKYARTLYTDEYIYIDGLFSFTFITVKIKNLKFKKCITQEYLTMYLFN